MENMLLDNAKHVFSLVCEHLDERGLRYTRDDENLNAYYAVVGEDLRVIVDILVDAKRQIVRITSPYEFSIPEELRVDAAKIINMINYRLVNGFFNYDITSGQITFVVNTTFADSLIGKGTIGYLIGCTTSMADRFNDKLFMFAKGAISTEQLMNMLALK